MNIPLRIMQFRRKEKVPDQLHESTLPPHDCFRYLQGIPEKQLPLYVGLLDSKCLHFDLWNFTGIQFIKACIKNKGLRFLNITSRGHQPGGSTAVLGQVFGFEGSKMVLLGSTTSKIAIRFFKNVLHTDNNPLNGGQGI